MRAAMHVRIAGGGVAASCCARLLGDAGLRVSVAGTARPAVPALLLSGAALALLRDVFGRPDLLADRPAVRRRAVRWHAAEVTLPHAAISVSETELLNTLGCDSSRGAPDPIDFTVRSASTAAPPRRFGTRAGSAVQVRLRDAGDSDACRMEALERGWLFMVPGGTAQAWLLGVGAPLADLLAESRSIGPLIELAGPVSAGFDAAPRLAVPAAGEDWLSAGSASIGFDPICGDGAAQAVRQAILAAGVIVALAQGGDRPALLGHYQAMLIATMRRHLALSLDFYARGAGDWWQAQAAVLREGHDWCTARLAALPAPGFVLNGFRLVPRAMAA